MTLGPRPPLALALSAIVGALLMMTQPAVAQANDDAKNENLQRAQKAADSVFRWIKLNAQNGANRQQPTPAAPTPAPAPAPARKSAPAAVASAPKPPQAVAQPLQSGGGNAPLQTAAPALPPAGSEPSSLTSNGTVIASAAPTPTPDAPLAAAAKAAEPASAPPDDDDDDQQLTLLSKVDPVIPRQLLQTGFRRDIVQVRFTIGPSGKVEKAEVMKAINRRLGVAATDAVKQWRFAPIQKAREVAVEFAFQSEE